MASTVPQPTALKLLRGNPGKRRINRREPKPEPSASDPPAWLVADARALAIWTDEAPRLLLLGLLGNIDRLAFAALCERAATYQRAAEEMRERQTVEIKRSAADGYQETTMTQTAPHVSIARGALYGFLQLASRFGMSPADRARIMAEPEGGTKSRWAGRIKA